MTVSSTSNRVTFAGDSATTSFATSPVIFYLTAEMTVTVVNDTTLVETVLVENTDYTVTGGAGTTGTISLAGGSSPHGVLVTGTTLVLLRVLPLTQLVDLVNNSITDAEVAEDIVDKLVLILQQMQEQYDRIFSFTTKGTVTISNGSGTPEAVVTANIGSVFMRVDGGASTSIYVKESGTGNTGWVGK